MHVVGRVCALLRAMVCVWVSQCAIEYAFQKNGFSKHLMITQNQKKKSFQFDHHNEFPLTVEAIGVYGTLTEWVNDKENVKSEQIFDRELYKCRKCYAVFVSTVSLCIPSIYACMTAANCHVARCWCGYRALTHFSSRLKFIRNQQRAHSFEEIKTK